MSSDSDHDTHKPQALSRVALGFGFVIAIAIVIGLVFTGLVPRWNAKKQQDENLTVLGDPQPQVVVLHPKPEQSQRMLTLPGSLDALQEIKVNARVDGYIGHWYVDIGDHVRTGQKLATIEAPELTQKRAEAVAQVAQSQAEVAQAQADVHRISSERARLVAEEEQAVAEVGENQANISARQSDADFARVSNDRWQKLVKDQAISLQEADQRATTFQAARANVQSAREKLVAARSMVKAAKAREVALQAEIETGQARVTSARAKVTASQTVVDQIDSQLRFCIVTAPFSGVVTQRYVDVGSLVSAGGDKTILFDLAQSKRLRVFVDVPEPDAPSIAVGQRAQLKIKEFPDRLFNATVTRTSGSLNNLTRTLKTQIELENPGPLSPGMHADVLLTLKTPITGVVIPATAEIVRPDGPKVLVVDSQNKIVIRNVTLGLDYGRTLQIISGLTLTDTIVNFPPDGLIEGEVVRPSFAAPPVTPSPVQPATPVKDSTRS